MIAMCAVEFNASVLQLSPFYIHSSNIPQFIFATDYYYQTYYKDVSLPDKETELSVQQDQDIEASTFNSKDQSQIENEAYAGTDTAESVKCGQEDHFASDAQVRKCLT